VPNRLDATGEPIRCELVPVPPRVVENFLLPTKEKPTAPPLVLEVGIDDAIRVIDANTKALVASDWILQVTATPTKYLGGDENNPSYTQPLLALHVPGLRPLRIGPRPMDRAWGRPRFRYGWRGRVRGHKEPAYEVTEAEWLTLVEKFGLGTRVVDERAAGKIRRVQRVMAMTWLWWGLPLFILVAWAVHHFVR
jgi:hypothetical protein